MKGSLAALGCLFGLAVAGCAQSEDVGAPPPESPPLTKAQLIKQGDRICKASNRRLDAAVTAELRPNPTAAQVKKIMLEVAVPELEGQVAALRELVPPSSDAPMIDLMLDAVDEAIEETRKNPIKVVRDDDAFDDANRIARKYGFKHCSE